MKVNASPVYIPVATSASSKAREESAATATFEQSRAAAAEKSAVTRDVGQDLPVEAYAIPEWTAGFSLSLGSSDNMGKPVQLDPKTQAFADASPKELAEYSELLQKHLADVYERNGLTGASARYNVIKSVPGLSERLHAEFNESISSDARMVSLMDKLGARLTPLS